MKKLEQFEDGLAEIIGDYLKTNYLSCQNRDELLDEEGLVITW